MSEVNFTKEITLENVEDRKKLLEVIKSAADAKLRIASERELIKTIVGDVCKELGIEKRVVNKLVTTYFKQNFDEEVETHEEFENLYKIVIAG